MLRLIVVLFVSCFVNVSNAQIKALTETGREVLLSENGTWKYSPDSANNDNDKSDSISTNSHSFSKTNKESFLVKSKNFNVGVYINPSKWLFSPHKENEKIPEYRFSMKSDEGYTMMITERTPISLENMPAIALINAQKASMDIKETFKEYRIVNNKKVLCLKMEGTIQGVKFTYLGYYYSNQNGTIQLLCYTSQNLFDGLKNELETFLNGLVELSQ